MLCVLLVPGRSAGATGATGRRGPLAPSGASPRPSPAAGSGV